MRSLILFSFVFVLPLLCEAGELIGKVIDVKKRPEKIKGQDTGPLYHGQLIYLGDVIKTDSESEARIQFLDESKLVIGANVKIDMNKDVYDPVQVGSVANHTKGVLRFIDAKIKKVVPDKTKDRQPTSLPAAGFRG